MHIAEGVLAAPVLGTGAALAAAGCSIGIKKMRYDEMPKVALISSTFFVAALIHVPVGPTSAHLTLNGLAGVLLGWSAFPALLLALLLQAILFQFGGFTTLGVNTVSMASPAVLCYLIFKPLIIRKSPSLSVIAGFFAGSLSIFVSGLLVALSLSFSGDVFINVAKMIMIVHIPIMIIEGILTGFVILFLRKIKPELLGCENFHSKEKK